MGLLNRTLEMISKAKTKGFDMEHQITPLMFENWMDAEKAFCNTACAIISMWLREKQGLYVNVAGPRSGSFSYFGRNPIFPQNQPYSIGADKTWEEAWLTCIEKTLHLLPNT